jgi:hypothetical protein
MDSSSPLTANQIARIRAIAGSLREVDPRSEADWIEGFAQDGMPEREICTWEVMALAYSSFTSRRDLSDEAKRAALALALDKSLGRTNDQILTRRADGVLSAADQRIFSDDFAAAQDALTAMDRTAQSTKR